MRIQTWILDRFSVKIMAQVGWVGNGGRFFTTILMCFMYFAGLETDAGEGISKEVDVERIEFFVKEEVTEVEE